MSKIVISVDMEIADEGPDSVSLIKVANAENADITDLYARFCKSNGYDISKKSDIENAAVPFIRNHETILP